MEIEKIIADFIQKKVVVIGDVMVDEYIAGSVQRLSPEMSVPLLLRTQIPAIEDDLVRLGGAGNVARNIASLGADVTLIGVCGTSDPASAQLKSLIAYHSPEALKRISSTEGNAQPQHRLAIDCRIIPQDELITTHKLRLINKQSVQLFRVDTEKDQKVSETTIALVLEEFERACKWSDVIVVSDYAKGLITAPFFRRLREIAGDKRIVVDPKERDDEKGFCKYFGATIIIPNEKELRRSFSYSPGTTLEQAFSGDLQGKLGKIHIDGIICTRGADGVMYSETTTDKGEGFAGKVVEVADVTGASDVVTATVALVYAQLKDLATAARIAEAAGRLKVTKRLTGTVHIAELLNEIDPMIQRRARAKLHLNRADFLTACEKARSKSKSCRVAFITGCFDILHRGHLRLFEHAAEIADVVVVAVNSDDYIRRSPHKIGGPYLDEESRATLIASLASVDIVTVFDEDTPDILISQIQPTVLVMGEEYKKQYQDGMLPGMDFIRNTSATVEFVGWDETRNMSSSAIAVKIRNALGSNSKGE